MWNLTWVHVIQLPLSLLLEAVQHNKAHPVQILQQPPFTEEIYCITTFALLVHHIRSACQKKKALPKGWVPMILLAIFQIIQKSIIAPLVHESYVLDLTAELTIPFDQWVQVGNTIGKYSEVLVWYTPAQTLLVSTVKQLKQVKVPQVESTLAKLNREKK